MISDSKYLPSLICVYCAKQILMRKATTPTFATFIEIGIPNFDLDEKEKASADLFLKNKDAVIQKIMTIKPTPNQYVSHRLQFPSYPSLGSHNQFYLRRLL